VNCLVSQYADLDLNSEIVQRSALGFTNKATVGVPHCGEGMFQSSDQDRTSQAALGRSCSRPWPTTPRSRSSDHKRVPGDRCPVATMPHIRLQQISRENNGEPANQPPPPAASRACVLRCTMAAVTSTASLCPAAAGGLSSSSSFTRKPSSRRLQQGASTVCHCRPARYTPHLSFPQ